MRTAAGADTARSFFDFAFAGARLSRYLPVAEILVFGKGDTWFHWQPTYAGVKLAYLSSLLAKTTNITDNLTGKIIKAAGPDGKFSFKLTE